MSEYTPDAHERTDPRLRVVSEQMAHVEAENGVLLKRAKTLFALVATLVAGLVPIGGLVVYMAMARADGIGALKLAEEAKADAARLERKLDSRDAGLRSEIQLVRQDVSEQGKRFEVKLDRIVELMERKGRGR